MNIAPMRANVIAPATNAAEVRARASLVDISGRGARVCRQPNNARATSATAITTKPQASTPRSVAAME
ncbi:MAG: hypothetical protein U0R65_02170 [Candidatus Nanopelagicales bacterium]